MRGNPRGTPENLKRWKPGQSGNPGGRPKKRPVTDCYADVLNKPLPDELVVLLKVKKGTTYGEAIALGQAVSAIKGKAESAREIREAIEGRATQRLELTGAEGGPLQGVFEVVHIGIGMNNQPGGAGDPAQSKARP